MLNERRVLVTGGAGFIGSHLCERLLRDGDEVLCVDNFFTGTQGQCRAICSTNPRFELMRHDVTFPLYVEVDEIYNLACPASPDPLPVRSGADDQDQRASAPSTCWAWPSACRRKILQASTSEVYGDPTVHPQTEDYWGNVNPIGLRSCYDEGKRCAETLFFDYCRQHQVAHQGRAHLQHLRSAHAPQRRPRGVQFHRPGAAGPGHHDLWRRQPDPRVLLRRRPGRGLIRLMDTPDEVTGPINIGNPGEFTIRELAGDGRRP